MKKDYKKIEMTLISLKDEDVITASGQTPTGPNELEPDLEGIF